MLTKRSTIIKAAAAFLLAAFLCACDSGSTTTDPIVIKVTGRQPIVLTWNDARVNCPECIETTVTINTPERGDIVYGPYPFVFTGLTLNSALSGYNRIVTVEITDAGGTVIYRGVQEGVTIIADKTNDPLFCELFPRGWHRQIINMLSADWLLNAVDIESSATVSISGEDRTDGKGMVLKGTLHTFVANTLPAVSADWLLNSVAGLKWAAGEDVTGTKSLILRYDGLLWHDNIAEPACAAACRLYSVSAEPGGTRAWAAGEEDVGAGSPIVYRLVSNVWTAATAPAVTASLFDVAAISGGDALFGGKNNGTGAGLITMWDDSATSYVDSSGLTGIVNPWNIDDVFALSADDWWAAGSETAATDIGIVLHHTTGGLATEKPAGPAVSWFLTGVWADATSSAVAVGHTAAGAIILRRSAAGVWAAETIFGNAAGWELYSIDATADGWAIAVGEDTANNKGLLLKYPFPR